MAFLSMIRNDTVPLWTNTSLVAMISYLRQKIRMTPFSFIVNLRNMLNYVMQPTKKVDRYFECVSSMQII